ncbi:MAG: DegT/DnrJ/EryC1/StrS family aminotransferase [Xanthomonadaceae bacterium]|nr:DegT/DnrJ/EryC1/StrS family aminotransferase [Xanthomonadaceae bacterium]
MNIPLNLSTFGHDEIRAAVNVLESGHVTMGKQCFEFEEQFAQTLNVKNAIFVNSGSSANLLAFFALANFAMPEIKGRKRMQPGDEVIVPALTWSTTVWPILQAGGVPVFVDSDPETLQMKFEDVEKAISPKTVAICPVHVLGNAVPMGPIKQLAEKHRLWIIEDTCESLGTKHQGKTVGTWGDIGTYSFFFSHHITTIEGGMIVTPHDDIAELLRTLRAHGWTRHLKNREAVEKKYPDLDPRYLFVNMGFNLRPTEVNAAFGKIQLKKLSAFNDRRVEIANTWNNAFVDLISSGSLIPMKTTAQTDSTWFGYPVLLKNEETKRKFQGHLEKNGIETRPIICGNLARQPAFKTLPHRTVSDLSGANRVMDSGIYWGSHPLMSKIEVDYVIKTVKEFW